MAGRPSFGPATTAISRWLGHFWLLELIRKPRTGCAGGSEVIGMVMVGGKGAFEYLEGFEVLYILFMCCVS